MKFDKLPQEVKNGIMKVAKDCDEFNKILSEDKILDELDEQKIDLDFERECFDAFIGKSYVHGNHFFKHISLKSWSTLWHLNSPIVNGSLEKIGLADIDTFFYVINEDDIELDAVEENSKNYSLMKYSDILDELPEIVFKLVKIAFFPLTFFPSANSEVRGKQEMIYDCDWMAKIIAVVSSSSRMSPSEIMNSSLYYSSLMYVQYAKMNSTNGRMIGRKAPQDVLSEQDYRACQLLSEYLAKQNVIKEDEIEKYAEMMHKI